MRITSELKFLIWAFPVDGLEKKMRTRLDVTFKGCFMLGRKRKHGFSFIEVVVVALIIGVLAALAFPNYRIQMLKIKNQEALRVLTAVWEAQKDYYRENGVYVGDINDLDVVIPPMKNFTNLTMTDAPISGCGGPVVTSRLSVDSMDSSYRVYMLENGRFFCKSLPLTGPCPDPFCVKMGFSSQYW